MSPQKKKLKKNNTEPMTENEEQQLKNFKIRPNSDLFFTTYFSDPQHEDVLVNLINAVLTNVNNPPIVSAKVLNPLNIKQFAIEKDMVLDIRAKDENGRIFDIEIQVANHRAFKERMLGYWADTYSGQLLRGDKYIALKPVISIIIVFENNFPKLVKRHQLFHLVSDENPAVLFSDHLCIHVLCLKGVGMDHLENIRDWNAALQGWSLFLSCEPEKLEEQMSVISAKNPVLIEVDKDFRRYTSNPEMRKLEHRRMSYNLAHRIEMGEVMELLKKAEESAAKSKAEGEAKGVAAKIANVLTRRFGVVPSRLMNSLYKIGHLEKLDELFDFALDCQTLEEFKAAMLR